MLTATLTSRPARRTRCRLLANINRLTAASRPRYVHPEPAVVGVHDEAPALVEQPPAEMVRAYTELIEAAVAADNAAAESDDTAADEPADEVEEAIAAGADTVQAIIARTGLARTTLRRRIANLVGRGRIDAHNQAKGRTARYTHRGGR